MASNWNKEYMTVINPEVKLKMRNKARKEGVVQ